MAIKTGTYFPTLGKSPSPPRDVFFAICCPRVWSFSCCATFRRKPGNDARRKGLRGEVVYLSFKKFQIVSIKGNFSNSRGRPTLARLAAGHKGQLGGFDCKPFGIPPTLFWTLDLGGWGWRLGAAGLVLGVWGLDLALGWALEAWGMGFWHMCYA